MKQCFFHVPISLSSSFRHVYDKEMRLKKLYSTLTQILRTLHSFKILMNLAFRKKSTLCKINNVEEEEGGWDAYALNVRDQDGYFFLSYEVFNS